MELSRKAENEKRNIDNEEVKKSLVQYCRFPHRQGFAVMLNGVWGSGKTTFIKDCLPSLVRSKPGEADLPPVYISLYGLSKPEEIDIQLVEQLHPVLGHKATRLFGTFVRGMSKIALTLHGGVQLSGAIPDLDLTSFLKSTQGRVVIFDDFERSLMKPTEVLGYINPLIEHDDCKVIIVADEDQIIDLSDYKRRKEKTIGQTFYYEPNTEGIYEKFTSMVETPDAGAFLKDFVDDVLDIFADSGLNNLRILKQFLWDFERMWQVLDDDLRADRVVMKQLLAILCASALELRSGRLKPDDLKFSGVGVLASRAIGREPPAEPMDEIWKRYPTVPFEGSFVEPQTVCDCVLLSRVSKERVCAEVRRHPAFAVRAQDNPSWHKLWLAFEARPDTQDEIVAEFEKDFNARAFVKPGEILHVIGLSLWLARLGYPNWLAATVDDKIRSYIDDVFAKREATLEEVANRTGFDMGGVTGGLGYRENETPEFRTLAAYEKDQRAAWRKRQYPALAKYLFELAKKDGAAFLREVCFTSAGPATYATTPVFHFIQAEEFAEHIVTSNYNEQKELLMALSLRYEQVLAHMELKAEESWLKEVKRLVSEKGKTSPRIAREAVSNMVAHFIDPALHRLAAITAT